MKQLRYMIEYVMLRMFLALVNTLPHRVLFLTSSFFGSIMYYLPTIGSLCSKNVKASFPELSPKECRTIARKSLCHLVQVFLEFIWFSNDQKRLDRFFNNDLEVTNLSKDITETGKGFVYVSPHLGNWELGALVFMHVSDIPLAAVARRIDNPYIHDFIISLRESEGTKILPAKGAIKGMMKALKQGSIVGTLIDQNTRCREGGIWVDFFNLAVPTSPAPAFFSRKMGVEVALGGCLRVGRKYTTFTKRLPKPTHEYKDNQELTQALMTATEELVREHPEQYLWFYKRFQHIPETKTKEERSKYPAYAEVVRPRFYDLQQPKDSVFPDAES